MKILFISSWFPNKLEPTNGNFVQRHAEAVALLHDVEILHAIGDNNQKEEFIFDDKIINDIRTLIIYYKNSSNPVVNFLRRMKAYKMGFSNVQKPDVVHANVLHNTMLFAVYLKKKYKIPFVVSEHWSALQKNNLFKTAHTVKIIAKYIARNANYILPVSNNLKDSLQFLGVRTPMKVIPNVVDTHLFLSKSEANSIFIFLHISNLIPGKNADRIINVAIKLLKQGYDFNLQIGGDGDISKLNRIVQKENLEQKIKIFGIQTLPQVADRMHHSDCFILFSDYENQPCVIAEAFASGIRVISTNVGGVSEFFPENFGILLEKPSEDLLEKAMISMLENNISYDRKELANYAKNTFSKEVVGRIFVKIYDEVITKNVQL
ncbi:glycosyltransferase family 4 protein [Chryseobacterium sp. SIMBA_029]|uniref:glycosyltransferase family 4 protein n=1 Tax=Chryseobacterium sp. SIMBA_029 TaxID=3085772 RepID=UPI0039784F20